MRAPCLVSSFSRKWRRFKTFSLSSSQFLRFIVAGVFNTLLGFAVYSAAVLAGLPIWCALIVGNVAGVAFNFVTTGGYVFRSLMLSHLPRFLTAYAIVYFINLKLIGWLSILVPGSIRTQAVLTIPMALFSYFLMKRFVFAGGNKIGQSDPRKSVNAIGGGDDRE